MKLNIHKYPKHFIICGFTLIELTVVILVGLMIALMTLTLFNQQLAMFSILRNQNFMIHEAPQVNSLLNRLISRSNSIVVDKPNHKITLTFINPSDNSTTSSEIVFENNALIYKNETSEWNISTQVKTVDFNYKNGVLVITLTGPNGGEIKSSITPL